MGDWPIVSNINLRHLHKLTEDIQDAISWCKNHGLLPIKRDCIICGTKMFEMSAQNRNDGIRWRCKATKCRAEKGIREGTFFENSRLCIIQLIDLMYAYSYETANVKNLMRECEITSCTITKWRNQVRSIYTEYFSMHPLKIGGPGHVIEIDESAFVQRKNKTQWVFGGLDTGTQECFLVSIGKRDAKILLSVVEKYVLPGSTVVSDLWRSYGIINELGYEHLSVNNDINFVDIEYITLSEMIPVKSMMLRLKERNKRECGTHEKFIPSYLTEFMWRQKFGNDPFQKLIEHIREIYPV